MTQPPNGVSAMTDDPVATVVEEVRADLAARRAEGTLPHLASDELERQFTAVVEAVEAGLIDEPLDTSDLAALAVLPTWRPARAGLAARLAAPFVHLVSRAVGAMVRRQVSAFSTRTQELLAELATRQHRASAFLVRAHLDRIRTLEARVAELERRLGESSAPDA